MAGSSVTDDCRVGRSRSRRRVSSTAGAAARGGGGGDTALSAGRDEGCPRSAPGGGVAARARRRRPGRSGAATGEGLRRLLVTADRVGIRADVIAAIGRAPHDNARAEAGARAARRRAVVVAAGGRADVGRRDRRAVADGCARSPRRRQALRRGAEPAARRLPGAAGQRHHGRAYVYASASDETAVKQLVGALGDGRVDAIAFSSASQVDRCRRSRSTPDWKRRCARVWRGCASPPWAPSSTARWLRAASASTSSPRRRSSCAAWSSALAAALGRAYEAAAAAAAVMVVAACTDLATASAAGPAPKPGSCAASSRSGRPASRTWPG